MKSRSFVRNPVFLTTALLSACSSAPPKDSIPNPAPTVEPVAEMATPLPAGLPLPSPQHAGTTTGTQLIPGTGRLFNEPRPPSEPAVPATDGQGTQLSFVDTDIGTVIASVLGDGLGVDYIIDPALKGTISLQSSRPLARDEMLGALEAALRVYDVAIVKSGESYRVLPMAKATRQATLRTPASRGQPGFGVHLVPLRFVSATEMQKAIEPFVPEGGLLRADDARHLLVLAGSQQDVDHMLQVIDMFDVDWLAGMSFAMFTLSHVDVQTLMGELEKIITAPGSPFGGMVRLVPITRLNAIMVISPQAAYFTHMESWIRRLDISGGSPGRRIYVYDVQHGKATDLAQSLNSILSLTGPTPLAADKPQTGPEAAILPDHANSMLESGSLKIVPNEENNSLLVLSTPGEFDVVEQALKRLDVPARQVLIEASIAEVTLTDDLKYGLQWLYQGGDGPLVLSEASNGGVAQRFPGFSYLFTGRPDIRAVLNAIQSVTNVKVLSAPKLMVLNNREANLQIGDQVPIATQSAVGVTNPDAPIVNTVQLHDTGVILRVVPRVNKNGLVLLEVAQEVSEVVPTTTSGIDSPTIQQRKLNSTVSVRSGETIALGGLIRERKSRNRSGVPFLTRIPLLGAAFRSTNDVGTRTELIILLTPRVVEEAQEMNEVMEDLREQFKRVRKLIPSERELIR